MNKIGFGFLRLPLADPNVPNTYDWPLISRMVDTFLEKGGRYFDTCYAYLDGYSEYGIRECLVKRYPRDSFELANKLPSYDCTCYEDCRKYFNEQLERCGVDYFDVYLLHRLNKRNYDTAEACGEFRFMQEIKKEGRTRLTGFSYHDSASLLDEILDKHPEIDIVQLQINYLDWDSAGVESRKCYEVCIKHGKTIMVMEPIKGGTLSVLPKEAEAYLRSIHPDWSPSSWALRFVQSLEKVEVCLSGMNTMEQMIENMRPIESITESERQALWHIRDIINSQTAVPCTGCRYCVKYCPMNIRIPDYFSMYNEISRYPEEGWKIRPTYVQASKGYGKPSDCIGCGACSIECPQKIDIPKYMKDVANTFDAQPQYTL